MRSPQVAHGSTSLISLPDGYEAESELNRLLRASSPLALALAPATCHRFPDGGRCDWYHGPWQTFRLLGAVTSAALHGQAIRAALREAARSGNCRRVLISGAADYAMAAMVHAAWQAEGAPLDLTVIDLCPTPLALCEWYAREQNITIHTEATDVLAYRSEVPFDLVCTHAFLGYFDDHARKELVRRWHALLRPGGQVITVQRVRPGCTDAVVVFTAAQAAAFVGKVRDAARSMGLPEIDQTRCVDFARDFTARFATYAVRSRAELSRLFTDAGFGSVKLDFRRGSEANTTGAAGGPSVPEDAEYAHIAAVKPVPEV